MAETSEPNKTPTIEMIASAISLRARRRRAESGRSLQQVADVGGLTRARIHEVERGNTYNPTLKTIHGVARGLGVSVHWLMGFSDDLPALSPDALRIAFDVDAAIRAAKEGKS